MAPWQDAPGLDAPESEARGVQATAAGAREHTADDDALLPEHLAQATGLGPAVGVEVSLGGAILEAGVGRIERAGVQRDPGHGARQKVTAVSP